MQEIFKDIQGYEGVYQVSNLGNVKSYLKNKDGKILNPAAKANGYIMVKLGGDVRKFCLVHRLVAKAFIPNPENKREVNHVNGIKTDNRLENLEWATPSENIKHSYTTGLKKGYAAKGADSPMSMPVTQLTLDGKFVANYAGANEAARQIGVYHQAGISRCCRGKSKTAYGFKWQYKI